MKKYLIIVFTFFLCCTNGNKTLDFEQFTIEVPNNWQVINERGIDSYVGRIAIDETDTISFDLGWYSNSLEDEEEYMIEDGSVYLKDIKKPNSYKFYGKADTTDLEKFKKTERIIAMINNRKVEIVKPKKSGYGITGIYIDSLWGKEFQIDKFQLNGKDLKTENEILLLKAIKTLKFKK